jgi:hypothetical protein
MFSCSFFVVDVECVKTKIPYHAPRSRNLQSCKQMLGGNLIQEEKKKEKGGNFCKSAHEI